MRWFVKGVSDACKRSGCVLIGGETAEIPGIYRTGCNDLVGAITGIVQESKLLNPKYTISEGDLVYGIPSDSPHTNGFTLIQKLINDSDKDNDKSYLRYVDTLCKPHKCYLNDIRSIVKNDIKIKGMCHITGGGYIDNPPRVISDRLEFEFNYPLIVESMPDWMKWIYDKVIHYGSDQSEVFKTFNCGFGMLVVVDVSEKDKLESMSEQLGGKFIGTIVKKSKDPFDDIL